MTELIEAFTRPYHCLKEYRTGVSNTKIQTLCFPLFLLYFIIILRTV